MRSKLFAQDALEDVNTLLFEHEAAAVATVVKALRRNEKEATDDVTLSKGKSVSQANEYTQELH